MSSACSFVITVCAKRAPQKEKRYVCSFLHAHSCTMHPEVVEEVSKRMVRGETLMKMSAFLKVVADPTRLSIVSALLIREMCVCDLAKLLGMEHSAVSHQLAVLRKSDIVRVRQEGKVKYYSLSDEHINTVFSVTFMHVNE